MTENKRARHFYIKPYDSDNEDNPNCSVVESAEVNEYAKTHYIHVIEFSEVERLEKERDEYKKLAESWMKDYDSLKEKYEPMFLVTSKSELDRK